MIQHESHLRVRYAETDQMGVVYHGIFAQYFEVSRAEMIRHCGLSYQQMEGMGVLMPVTEMGVKFFRPARYDDLLTLRSTIRDWPDRRLTVETEIWDQEGKLLVTGLVTLAFLDAATGKSIPCPGFFQDLLRTQWVPGNS